jgi:hypothetical protein
LDLRIAGLSRVGATATGQATDDADGHVVLTSHLATESNTGDFAGGQAVAFGHGHFRGFASDELHAASRAAGVAPAGMQLILSGIFGQCQDQAFAGLDLEFSYPFNGQLRHSAIS